MKKTLWIQFEFVKSIILSDENMKNLALKIDGVSKLYQLGEVGTGTISHDLNRWWSRLRGKEDPCAILGVENDRSKSGDDFVWALNDINLEIPQGEILGIIGKNGAGKSTLLKILSRVTGPTRGRIYCNGKIASLLEVGTGFHPELTGRENIYLNGALLGMTKRDITLEINNIIEFSGCSKYIDTPVKRYSSGMNVRLGFAVAAHLNCDILIVDEVLAVGDEEFQRKCIGKMQGMSLSQGRTVLVVSHTMNTIRQLCDSSIILDKGSCSEVMDTEIAVKKYLSSNFSDRLTSLESKVISVDLISVIEKNTNESTNQLFMYSDYVLNLSISPKSKIGKVTISFEIYNDRGEVVSTISSIAESVGWIDLSKNISMSIMMNNLRLFPGSYHLSMYVWENNSSNVYFQSDNVFEFKVNPTNWKGAMGSYQNIHGVYKIADSWVLH